MTSIVELLADELFGRKTLLQGEREESNEPNRNWHQKSNTEQEEVWSETWEVWNMFDTVTEK